MGYGIVRQQVFDRQNGQCQICGKFLTGRWAIHHLVNRKQGLDNRIENLTARCIPCENQMHKDYPFGNYEGNLKKGGNAIEFQKRGRNRRVKGKRSKPALPLLQESWPGAYFRQVKSDRPVPNNW